MTLFDIVTHLILVNRWYLKVDCWILSSIWTIRFALVLNKQKLSFWMHKSTKNINHVNPIPFTFLCHVLHIMDIGKIFFFSSSWIQWTLYMNNRPGMGSWWMVAINVFSILSTKKLNFLHSKSPFWAEKPIEKVIKLALYNPECSNLDYSFQKWYCR